MPQEPQELSDVEIVAISKSMGDARTKKAREQIANDQTYDLDFTVRITGTLNRGPAIADSEKLVTATLPLDRAAIHAATLKALKLKPTDYADAYAKAEAKAVKALAAAQAKVKPTKSLVKGRDGDINVAVDVTKVK